MRRREGEGGKMDLIIREIMEMRTGGREDKKRLKSELIYR